MCHISGVKPLRDAIAEFHRRFPTGIPDITLQADNIVVGDGSKMIIYLILMVTDTGTVKASFEGKYAISIDEVQEYA